MESNIWGVIRVLTDDAHAQLREQGFDCNMGMKARYIPGALEEVAENIVGCNVFGHDSKGKQKVVRVRYPKGWHTQAELERRQREQTGDQIENRSNVSRSRAHGNARIR